jgi:hypothetical protein
MTIAFRGDGRKGLGLARVTGARRAEGRPFGQVAELPREGAKDGDVTLDTG